MRTILDAVHTIWAFIMFVGTAIFFLLPQILVAGNPKWHKWALKFNNPWSRVYFALIFFNLRIRKKHQPKPGQQYIICSNHFSYLDIPVMPVVGFPFKYIGKSSIQKIPVFGYMFKKIHIKVNRESLKSRAGSLLQCRKEIENGFSVTFFPEGGIKSTNPPKMVKFRDGAFRLAVETGLPVLPVVMHDNYKIYSEERPLLRHGQMRVSVLDPIYPKSSEEESINLLKEKTYKVIQSELDTPTLFK